MIASIGKDVEKLETTCTASRNVNGIALWKTFWWFLKMLNIEIPYDPEIPLSIVTQEN